MNIPNIKIFPILLLALVAVFGCKKSSETLSEKTSSKLPLFSFKTVDGKVFSEDDLSKNTAIIFVYFSSDCHYCQEEASSFVENRASLKDVEVIFVSEESQSVVKEFAEKYKLSKIHNFHVVIDEAGDFFKKFQPPLTPFVLIYNQDWELLQKAEGAMPVSEIIKVVETGKTIISRK